MRFSGGARDSTAQFCDGVWLQRAMCGAFRKGVREYEARERALERLRGCRGCVELLFAFGKP